jgi:Tubulin/FtsZ family, GTPase domain
VGIYEAERTARDRTGAPEYGDHIGTEWQDEMRLGQDVRFVLVAVGGGAIRVASEIARKHVRHLETVAINCDPKVQGFEEFDRRVYLGPDTGAETDTGGSPYVGGTLARAAEPALERIFDGATFVILVGSLGGGAGSGAFPYILEVACRSSEIVSAFVIKPFRCEGERRALADRSIGRLQFVESFVARQERGLASIQTLDNESLTQSPSRVVFSDVTHHWARVIEHHIETSFVAPVEAMIEAARLVRAAEAPPMNRIPEAELPALGLFPPPSPTSGPEFPPLLPAAPGASAEVELTFEVEGEARPPPAS